MPTTPEIRKKGEKYDVSFWADYFPDSSVVYRVRINRLEPRTSHEFLAQGKLFYTPDEARQKNSAQQAAIRVSDDGIKFFGVPQISGTEGASRVSRIQIAGVEHLRLDVAYCD